MTQRQTFRISFLILFVLLLYQFGLILSPFFMPIMWAVILARLTYPMYERLRRWSRGRENLSAALMTLAIVFVAILPAVYLVTLGIQEAIAAYQRATEWIQGGGLKRLPELLLHIPVIGEFSQELIGRAVVTIGDLQGSIVEGGKTVSGFLLAQMGNIAKNTLEFVTDFLLMLFTLFFLLRDGHRLYDILYQAIPLDPEHKAAIVERLTHTVGAVVKGTLLTAMAQGAVAGTTYWLLGIPFPVFLGGLSALLALLPVGGTAFVWGPLAVYLLITGAVWKGLVLIAVGAGLVGLMDNILQPWLIGAKADLPLLFLFFATIGGIAYFGFIGLFLGPIILGIILAAFGIYREEFLGSGSPLVQPTGTVSGETPVAPSGAEREPVGHTLRS
jgi:predicted PurR-regulated permease PerM